MALRDTEKLVQAAVDAGLIGAEPRRMLLDGLPMGFIYSLPTVSRPIDQLRFDLMELARTPRLIGLDRKPLAVWLDNAVTLLLERRAFEAARTVAAEADRMVGGDAHARRVEAALDGAARPVAPERAPVAESRRPALDGASGDAHGVLALAVGATTKDAHLRAVPAVEPRRPSFLVGQALGPHFGEHLPDSTVWEHWYDELDRTLTQVQETMAGGEALAVFPRIPPALGALLGARIADRLEGLRCCVFQRGLRGAAWAACGPDWLGERPSPADPGLRSELAVSGDPSELALIIRMGDPLDRGLVNAALAGVSRAAVPIVEVALPAGQSLSCEDPSAVEGVMTALIGRLDAIRSSFGRLGVLHVFFTGPVAVMVRLGEYLQECRFTSTVHHHRPGDGWSPLVHLGGGRHPRLHERRAPAQAPGHDVFLAYPAADRPFALSLKSQLEARGLSVFVDVDDLNFGDNFMLAIPRALERARFFVVVTSIHARMAHYLSSEIARAIQHARSGLIRRIVPVLLDGLAPTDLPYGLEVLNAVVGRREEGVERIAARLADRLSGDPSADLPI